MRRALGVLALITLSSLCSVALAEPRPQEGGVAHAGVLPSVTQTTLASGKGQDALAIGVAGDELVARVCPATKTQAPLDCDPSGATTIHLPAAVKQRISTAALRKVRTSQGKELVEVTATTSDNRRWVALVAAGDDASPRVAWSGFTVVSTTGPQSENRSEYVVQKDGSGEKIAVTNHTALCGKSVVSARLTLDPKTLTMTSVAIDDPAPEARKAALKITAKKLASAPVSLDLLRSPHASSGSAAALVDGDPKTAWTEDAPGVGTNQFVAMSAPESVAVLGFDLQLVPPQDLEGARAPKNLLLVTQDRSFAVDLPEDALASVGGAPFSIELAEPIHTRCLALVLGDDYPAKPSDKKAGKPAVPAMTTFVSELSLRTRFTGLSAADLAAGLKGGADDAHARAEILAADGAEGVTAAIHAYPNLDGPGQDLARRVIDASSCREKLALYVPMLASKDEDAVARAHDHVRRCGKEAAAPLLADLASAHGEARSVFAEELALISPDAAVPALVAGLSQSTSPADRLLFRKALLKSAERDSSVRAFGAALDPDAFAPLSTDTKLDLLRAMGKRLGEAKRGNEAFADVAKQATDFRGRYLLLGPAAALARSGDATATTSLSASLATDPDARIRARAAEVAQGIGALDKALLAAAADSAVRVREAATRSLEGKKLGATDQVVLSRGLVKEPWTFVKRAVVQALSGMKGDAQVDATLVQVMDHEDQPTVRQDILGALGARGARAQRDAIKERATDSGEAVDVRVEALRALGQICDTASLDDLTKIALKGATPFYEADRKLSTAAISALGRLHPKDLAVRVAPLMTAKVPGDVSESAHAALAEPHVCR